MSAAPTRRILIAGAAAVIGGSTLTSGMAAGFAAAVDPLPIGPDAGLLALRAELMAAVAGVAYDEDAPDWSDEEITRSAARLSNVCWAISDAPRAQTTAGSALKAAACMHQLRFSYNGCWPGDGEEMAWNLLSEMAGDVYVPPVLSARLRANCEPARAGA